MAILIQLIISCINICETWGILRETLWFSCCKFIPLYCLVLFSGMYVPQCVFSTIHPRKDICFQFEVMNKVAINICRKVCGWIYFIYLEYMSESAIDRLYSIFKFSVICKFSVELPNCSPEQLYYFIFPPTMYIFHHVLASIWRGYYFFTLLILEMHIHITL